MHPEKIGKYYIEKILGKGAMGVVYSGRDPLIDRKVAIKTIHSHLLEGDHGQEFKDRFKTEATAAGKCNHTNIVTIFEYGEHDDMPFIAMEYISGIELKDFLRKEKTISLKKINNIIQQVLKGLHYAHQHNVVHRDIKPANIIVLNNGEVKLADFGIAKLDSSDMTCVGDVLGTPSYMSPEQSYGKTVDQRSDIFSLGVVLFEMLSYCENLNTSLRTHKVSAILDLPPSRKLDYTQKMPASLAEFFNQCLAFDCEQRLGNIKAFLDAYKIALKNISKTKPLPQTQTQSDDSGDETVLATSAGTQLNTVELQWLESRLLSIEKSLAAFIGPMAGALIQKHRTSTSEIMQLVQLLADEIPDETDKKLFLEQWRSDDSIATSFREYGDTVTQHHGLNLTPEFLNKIKRSYANFMGPISEFMVEEKLQQSSTVEQLIRKLADEIPVTSEQQSFCDELNY